MDRGGCRALQIDRRLNRLDLTTGESLWFEDRGVLVRGNLRTYPRIGVDYAGEWAKKPWRFRLCRVGSAHSDPDAQKNRGPPDSIRHPRIGFR